MPASPRPTDEQLARAARAGSKHAFAALVRRYGRQLFRFLRLRAGSADDAEELLQDVLLRCWSRLDLYDPSRPFSTWLYTVAARQAVSRARRPQLPNAPVERLGELSSGPDPADALMACEARQNLWDTVARLLAPQARSALWLFYAEGRSAREVAEILGKREAAVRVMLHRAREKLAADLPLPAGAAGVRRP
ncbi:MAG: sigma-70 family RNA polymerase sigma factor [Planctomycetota bacterium]